MKIEQDKGYQPRMRAVGDLEPGTAVINGEGNLCMVCRDRDPELVPAKVYRGGARLVRNPEPRKVRIVNLQNGGSYKVLMTCIYEVVDARVVWGRS